MSRNFVPASKFAARVSGSTPPNNVFAIAWNALEVGTAVFDNVGRIYDERVMNDLTAGSGAATGTGFKLNLNGAGSATTANIGFDPMYGDAIVLDAGAYFHVPPTDDELRWAFEGLIPGSSYDLKFYSPGAFTDGFSINGDGLIPRDGDGNTLALSIIADVNGRIDGAFHHISPPLPVVYWAGVQIRGEFAPVPEPTSLLLFALGATALTRRRR